MALQPNSRMTTAEQDAFLAVLEAKNAVFKGIVMMAADDSDDGADGGDDAADSDDDSEGSDDGADEDESGDDDSDEGDDDEGLTEDEAAAADAEVDELLGEGGKKTLEKYRRFLKENGIDEQTGKRKVKAEDIKGDTAKDDAQATKARVALKEFAYDNGFDPEYSDVLTKLAKQVKLDADGDIIKPSVKAIIAELKEKKPAFFTGSDDEVAETKTRVTKKAPVADQRGSRTVEKVTTASNGLRGIESKINSKVALSDTETAKLAALTTPKAEALWDKAEELGLLTSSES